MFVNGDEQFVITMFEYSDEINQKRLTQIGEKKIRYILKDKGNSNGNYGYYIFACGDYDRYLHIFKSNDLDFRLSIKRNIQPGTITIFDAVPEANGTLKILSNLDDEFIIDQIKEDKNMEILSECADHEDEKSLNMKSYIFSSVNAFSFNWPYITFSGLENFLLVINIFDRKQIYRLQLASIDEEI